MQIQDDDLTHPQTIELLRLHLSGMHENSPPGQVFALDLEGLKRPDISFFTAWQGDRICGMGALRQLDATTGEIKSMRTHPEHLRQGVAVRLLEHIMGVARSRGIRHLCLETGSGEAFEPALRLYRRHGFTACGPFGDYTKSDFNQFMSLDLGSARAATPPSMDQS